MRAAVDGLGDGWYSRPNVWNILNSETEKLKNLAARRLRKPNDRPPSAQVFKKVKDESYLDNE